MKKIIPLLLIMSCCASVAFASIVVLDSGQKVEGKITERNDEQIKIIYEDVEVTFYLDEISTIDGVKIEVPEPEEYVPSTYMIEDEPQEESEESVPSFEAPVQEEPIRSEPIFAREQIEDAEEVVSTTTRDVTNNMFSGQQSSGLQGGKSLAERMEQRDFRGRTPPKAALGVILIPMFFILLIGIVSVAAYWKMYAKAGYPGWAALVPIYNIYIMVKIAGKPGWWMVLMFIPIVSIIILIIINIGIAQNFGKGIGYGLGLTLLPLIFVPVLGFGSAQYLSNKSENSLMSEVI